jgi:hypothetical protein
MNRAGFISCEKVTEGAMLFGSLRIAYYQASAPMSEGHTPPRSRVLPKSSRAMKLRLIQDMLAECSTDLFGNFRSAGGEFLRKDPRRRSPSLHPEFRIRNPPREPIQLSSLSISIQGT